MANRKRSGANSRSKGAAGQPGATLTGDGSGALGKISGGGHARRPALTLAEAAAETGIVHVSHPVSGLVLTVGKPCIPHLAETSGLAFEPAFVGGEHDALVTCGLCGRQLRECMGGKRVRNQRGAVALKRADPGGIPA